MEHKLYSLFQVDNVLYKLGSTPDQKFKLFKEEYNYISPNLYINKPSNSKLVYDTDLVDNLDFMWHDNCIYLHINQDNTTKGFIKYFVDEELNKTVFYCYDDPIILHIQDNGQDINTEDVKPTFNIKKQMEILEEITKNSTNIIKNNYKEIDELCDNLPDDLTLDDL